jgi:uncharacterized protein (DUF983 family)
MFRGWFHLIDYCDHCGFRFDRNERDYFIGAYTINLIVSETLVVIAMVVAIALTWPAVPWNRIKWIMFVCIIPVPALTYPYSKSVWLAIDLMFQPPIASEFKQPDAATPAR